MFVAGGVAVSSCSARLSGSQTACCGAPSKARTRASSATSCRVPSAVGSVSWNRNRTSSSVVRVGTAVGAHDAGRGGRAAPARARRRRGRSPARSGRWPARSGSVRAMTASPRPAGGSAPERRRGREADRQAVARTRAAAWRGRRRTRRRSGVTVEPSACRVRVRNCLEVAVCAEGGADLVDLGGDVLGLDGVLGVAGAGGLLLLGGGLPGRRRAPGCVSSRPRSRVRSWASRPRSSSPSASASMSACPSPGTGTATPVALAMARCLRMRTSSDDAVDAVVLAVEGDRADDVLLWPNRSTRPSRCSWRVGFQARS